MNNFDIIILDTINSVERSLRAKPLVLGGVTTSGGGSGGPPGGFIGYLPQSRVAGDYTEAETWDFPASGITLLDNLNRIRYRINSLEESTTVPVHDHSTSITGGTTLQVVKDIYRFGFVTTYAGTQETTIAFDGVNTFTLSPTSSNWSYYRNGIKYTISGSKTVTLTGSPPASKNIYFIYIDATDGTLSSSTNSWTLEDTKVPVATVLWDNSLTPKYFLADERHSCAIDRRFHWEHHFSDGTEIASMPTISGYTIAPVTPANTDNTLGISSSTIVDEDIKHSISSLADGDGTSTVYTLFYRTGSATWVWESSAVPYKYTGAGYIEYDLNGTMTAGSNNKYYNTYLVITTLNSLGYVFLSGNSEFTSLAAAQAELFSSITKTGLGLQEYVAVYQFTWSTNSSYTTKGMCRLAAAPKQIMVSASGASTDGSARVTSISVDDSSGITGDINFESGTNMTLVRTGNNIQFNAVASSGTGSLTVEEIDGLPSVVGVNKIKFSNGTVTDDGDGVVTVTISGGSSGGITVKEQDGAPTVNNVTTIKVTNTTLTDNGDGSVNLQTGNMLKSVYDADDDGIVDNSEQLGGQLPSYYATSDHTHTTYLEKSIFTGKGQLVTASGTSLPTILASGVDGQKLVQSSSTTTGLAWMDDDYVISVTMGNGADVVTSGTTVFIPVPVTSVVESWQIVSDASGSATVDVWKDTYANFPPTVADTIAGTEKPTLSSQQKNEDTNLTTWTTTLTKGEWLAFNLAYVATVKRITVVLYCRKTAVS